MDYTRISKIYNYVYSTPRNSPERVARLEELSEADRRALYNYTIGLLNGKIKKIEVKEMAAEQRSYEWYKQKMDEADVGNMRIVSEFALNYPQLYKQYRERYQAEKDEQRRINNRRNHGILDWRYKAIIYET